MFNQGGGKQPPPFKPKPNSSAATTQKLQQIFEQVHSKANFNSGPSKPASTMFQRPNQQKQPQGNLPYYQARNNKMNPGDFHRERLKAFGNDDLASSMPSFDTPVNRGGGRGGGNQFRGNNRGFPGNRGGMNRNVGPEMPPNIPQNFPQGNFQGPPNRRGSGRGTNMINKGQQRNQGGNVNNPKKPQNKPKNLPPINLPDEDIFKIQIETESCKLFTCSICKTSNIAERNLYVHKIGKKHSNNQKVLEESLTGRNKQEREKEFKALLNDTRKNPHMSQFESIIKAVDEALIGLTYCIEILNPLLNEPVYVCVLCDKTCDPRAMVNHFGGILHKSKYITKHFPALAAILNDNPRYNDELPYRHTILAKIAEKMEALVGRGHSYLYEGSEYNDKKEILHAEINSRPHINDEHIKDAEKVLIEGIDFENVEIIPVARAPKKQVKEKNLDLNPFLVQQFKKKVAMSVKELNEKLKKNKKDPGAHPSYNAEWEKFLSRKCEENGPDIKEADMLNEWYDFFVVRIDELHNEAIQEKIEEARKHFSLPKVISEKIDLNTIEKVLYEKPLNVKNSKNEQKNVKRHQNDGPGTSRGDFNDRRGNFGGQRGNFGNFNNSDDFGPPIKKFMSDPQMNSWNDQRSSRSSGQSSNFGGQVKLIPTLRILSNLETELGLLAPKILELLSVALTFEREKQNSSDELLFNAENFNMMEMVKEKLLGLQAANLIPMMRVQAVQKALGDITKLLDQHDKLEKIQGNLAQMGKSETSPAEMQMLMEMFTRKNNQDGKGFGGGMSRNKPMMPPNFNFGNFYDD